MSLLIRPDTTFFRKKVPCYYGGALHLLAWEVSLLIGPYTTSIRKGSVLAQRAGHYFFLGKRLSLLIRPTTKFIRKGSVPANRASHYIYQEGKCLCL